MITTNLKKKTKGWKLKMCGIVGITGKDNAVEILINGLEKLEYRGYDSAGIYVNNGNGNDFLVKVKGRIADLKDKVTADVKGTAGIGHTRWATRVKRMRIRTFRKMDAFISFTTASSAILRN